MKSTLAAIARALGISKQAVASRAARERWPYDESPVRGGRQREYPVATLPKAVRDALQHQVTATLPVAAAPLPEAAPPRLALPALPPRFALAELRDDERAALSGAIAVARYALQLAGGGNGSVRAAAEAFAAAARAGELPPEIADELGRAQLKPRAGGVSSRTVRRWIEDYRRSVAAADDGHALVRSNRRASPGLIHGGNAWWAMALLRRYCVPAQPPVSEAWADARKDLQADGHADESLPSYANAARLIHALPVTVKNRGRMSGAALRAELPYRKRDTSLLFANDAWVGDGHTFKARVAHPDHGQAFQPEVTLVIDWASRKIVGSSVALSENVIAVSDALRDAVRRTQCKPLVYYSDNGSGQTARLLDAPIVGICERVGIAHQTGIPGNPQGRGIIERMWQTVMMPLARKYATVLTKSADRDMVRQVTQQIAKAQRAGTSYRGLPSWRQFIADLEQAIDAYNADHEHRSLGKLTPDAAYLQRIAPYSVVKPTAAELAEMFMPEVIRTCRRGLIQLHNNTYFHAELVNWLATDEQVRVGFDVHDPQTVVVRRLDGSFLCHAEWDGHASSAFPVAYLDQLRQQRVADAKKRLQARIDMAEAELVQTLEAPPLACAEEEPIDVEPVPAESSNVVALPAVRPQLFEADWTKYEWLTRNSSACTDEDRVWLDWYRSTREWADLYGGRAGFEVAAR